MTEIRTGTSPFAEIIEGNLQILRANPKAEEKKRLLNEQISILLEGLLREGFAIPLLERLTMELPGMDTKIHLDRSTLPEDLSKIREAIERLYGTRVLALLDINISESPVRYFRGR